MASLDLSGAPAPAPTGTGRRDDSNPVPVERLQRWAICLAGPPALALTTLLFFGLPLPGLWVAPLLLCWAAVLGLANRWAVGWSTGRMRRSSAPLNLPRLGLALVLGVGASWVATLGFFDGDADATTRATEIVRWDANVPALRQERSAQADIAARPVPTVEQDPAVVRLQQQLPDARKQWVQGWRDALCELDGTCGTRVAGVGEAYRKRLGFALSLAQTLKDVLTQLEAAKVDSGKQVATVTGQHDSAVSRVGEINRQLAQYADRRPEPLDRTDAFSRKQRIPVVGVELGALVVFVAIDWVLLWFVVLRLCRAKNGGGKEIPPGREDQYRRDDAAASGATPYSSHGNGE